MSEDKLQPSTLRQLVAYFLKLGFLDGYPGFYIAVANAFGVLVRQTRLYEEERRAKANA